MCARRDEPRARHRGAHVVNHTCWVLLLYGSPRERSFSRFLTLEVERLLHYPGAETCVSDPRGLPLPDSASADHQKVAELRELSAWSAGQVWTSPERHGAVTGIMKAQIDWNALAIGAVRVRLAFFKPPLVFPTDRSAVRLSRPQEQLC